MRLPPWSTPWWWRLSRCVARPRVGGGGGGSQAVMGPPEEFFSKASKEVPCMHTCLPLPPQPPPHEPRCTPIYPPPRPSPAAQVAKPDVVSFVEHGGTPKEGTYFAGWNVSAPLRRATVRPFSYTGSAASKTPSPDQYPIPASHAPPTLPSPTSTTPLWCPCPGPCSRSRLRTARS